jgi:pimeloyl-ACP methyl ester carboxylesterase
MTEGWPAGVEPSHVVSADGTAIAIYSSGAAEDFSEPPLILVHGTSGDHTTFRVVGPLFARTRVVHAIDRRGRGASGDTLPYSIGREFADVAAVADALAARRDGAVDVVGHSYGGRCALGAGLRTVAIRRIVCYEGAPTPTGSSYHLPGIDASLAERLAAGDPDGALAAFMAGVVGMSSADLAAYRANPVWPARAAAAGTIPRELEAEAAPEASLEALSRVRQPVLQLLGSASLPVFRVATTALDDRLADGRVVVIEGAQHAAHHTHAAEFVSVVEAFLS